MKIDGYMFKSDKCWECPTDPDEDGFILHICPECGEIHFNRHSTVCPTCGVAVDYTSEGIIVEDDNREEFNLKINDIRYEVNNGI